jgi:ribosomal protein L12E/L44/L45/RPP1/RPP2
MSKSFNIHDWQYKQRLAEIKDEEIDEANVTGTGASISTGESPAFATPQAFAKKGKWKNKNIIYKEQEEEEEELSRDVKVLEKLLSDKINTKDEWVDMFQLLMTHSEEINGLNDSTIRSLLQQSMKEL